MKKIIQKFTLILLLSQSISYAQKCEDLNEGIFEADFMEMKFEVERHGNFQLETVADFDVVYLHKVEKISDCEYLVKRHKVLQLGFFPKPNMKETVNVTIYKIEDGKLFYKATLVGTDKSMEGYFIKKSNEISEKFKKILEKE